MKEWYIPTAAVFLAVDDNPNEEASEDKEDCHISTLSDRQEREGGEEDSLYVAFSTSNGFVPVKLMSSTCYMPPPRPQQLAPSSGRASDAESQDLVILQLNVEDLTLPKLDVLEHLTSTIKANVVLLQETHKENNTILKLPDFTLAGHTNSKHYGLATFVKDDIK